MKACTEVLETFHGITGSFCRSSGSFHGSRCEILLKMENFDACYDRGSTHFSPEMVSEWQGSSTQKKKRSLFLYDSRSNTEAMGCFVRQQLYFVSKSVSGRGLKLPKLRKPRGEKWCTLYRSTHPSMEADGSFHGNSGSFHGSRWEVMKMKASMAVVQASVEVDG